MAYSKTILINNFKKQSISGLEFRSSNGTLLKLNSDTNLEYEKITTGESQKIIIKQIYPSTNNTLTFIFKREGQKEPNIVPLNYQDFDLNLYESGTLKWNYAKFLIETSINSFIIAILGMIGYYFLDLKLKELNGKIKTAKVDTEKSNSKADKLNERINAFMKFRLVYLSRLRDYDRENKFYKQLIINIFKNSESKIDDEKLKELITKELKTFLTKKDAENEMESIEILNKLYGDGNAR